jgi:diguanylate cyclase (GGDEF)-like protein
LSANAREINAERNISKAGSLLHSLVPRAQVFAFYDHEKECVWNSDGVEDCELEGFVADLPQEILEGLTDNGSLLRRTLPSGRTALVISVPHEEDKTAGVMIALFSKNDGQSSSFNPNLIKTVLEPALGLIGEKLCSSEQLLDLESKVGSISKELDFIYAVDEKIHGASGRHSSLAQIVGRSGRHLGINYSVLLIPSKRIRISATHSSWKSVQRKLLDRYLIEYVIPKMDGRRKPVILEIPPDYTPDNIEAGYQALLCPLLDKQGNVEGIFAQLGKVNQESFTRNDRRFMAHIGRKIEYVIERSFDAMTGFMNRSGFEAQLRESHRALRSDDDTHQIIYFDLDNLQLVNDTFSRKAGNEVILNFSRILEEGLPKSAVLSRLTGDDFCMLLTHASSEAALKYANGIREDVSALRYLEGDKSLQVTMSIGIASIDRKSGEGNALTTARMACESAKEHGSDRIEIYDEGNRSVIRRYDDMQLVAQIQQALDGNEFELLAQPITCLSGDSSSSRHEILLRMGDGDGGRVQTTALFSAAERYRLMPQIDRWVVSSTIAKLDKIHEAVEGQNAIFAMNLSGQSLGDDDFLQFIEHEIDRSNLPDSCLCFEITESAAVSNLKNAQAFIDRLRERGCRVSLDDFGAGLSSFAYLKNFNVDTLKIDGSFIRDIKENRISESMVAAITQVAKVMELKTVAEYVETEEVWEIIKKLGVDFAQGHFISEPVTLDSVLAELSETGS